MQINTKYSTFNNFNLPQKKEAENFGAEKQNEIHKNNNLKSINIRANYMPIAFKGNAPEIKNAFIVTKSGTNIPVCKAEKTGSYIVDKDSMTEVIYGNDAIKHLSKTSAFKYDTQIIFPKNSKGKLEDYQVRLLELMGRTSEEIQMLNNIVSGKPMNYVEHSTMSEKKDVQKINNEGENTGNNETEKEAENSNILIENALEDAFWNHPK